MTFLFCHVPVLCCTEPTLFVGASLLAIQLTAKSIAGVANHSRQAPAGAVFWSVSQCNKQLAHNPFFCSVGLRPAEDFDR
jgi:hypothetical protein